MDNIYECKGCGNCCRAIHLEAQMTPEFLTEQSCSGNEDAKFILNNWKQIDLKEVLNLRPEVDFPDLIEKMDAGTWWTCTRLESLTGKCMEYEGRPQVCKGYPFYGKVPHYFTPYTYNCGYYRNCFPKQEYAGLKADIILVDTEFDDYEEELSIEKTG